MQSIIITQPNTIEIRPMHSMPKIRGPKDALVEIKRISLCGSDHALFRGTYQGPSRYPITFGHEWSGVVREAGKDAKVKKGDRVTGDCSKWCGKCKNCESDKNLCSDIEKFGITTNGFSSRFVVVPDQYLYKDAHGLSFEILALTEVFSVALHAISRLPQNFYSQTITPALVIGGGPVGLAVYVLLKHLYGWKHVVIHETDVEKTKHLQKRFSLRSGHFLQIKPVGEEAEKKQSYQQLYQGKQFDVVFEAAGTVEAFQTALKLAKPKGNIVVMGMPSDGVVELKTIVLKALTVMGSIGGTGEFNKVLDFFSRHKELIKKFVTATYSYQDVEKAFIETKSRNNNIKVQIKLS